MSVIARDEERPGSFRTVEDANEYIGIMRRRYAEQAGQREDRIGRLEAQLAGAVDRIKALSTRARPDDPDVREAAYGRGYQAAVADALEVLVRGQ